MNRALMRNACSERPQFGAIHAELQPNGMAPNSYKYDSYEYRERHRYHGAFGSSTAHKIRMCRLVDARNRFMASKNTQATRDLQNNISNHPRVWSGTFLVFSSCSLIGRTGVCNGPK